MPRFIYRIMSFQFLFMTSLYFAVYFKKFLTPSPYKLIFNIFFVKFKLTFLSKCFNNFLIKRYLNKWFFPFQKFAQFYIRSSLSDILLGADLIHCLNSSISTGSTIHCAIIKNFHISGSSEFLMNVIIDNFYRFSVIVTFIRSVRGHCQKLMLKNIMAYF